MDRGNHWLWRGCLGMVMLWSLFVLLWAQGSGNAAPARAPSDTKRVLREVYDAIKPEGAQRDTVGNQSLLRALNALNPLDPQLSEPIREPLEKALNETASRARRAQLQRARERIRAYLQVLATARPPSRAEQVKQQLEEIYRDPSLQPPRKGWFERAMEKIRDWFIALQKWFSRLFGGLNVGAAAGWAAYTQWIIIALLVLIAALGGAYVLNRLTWLQWQKSGQQGRDEAVEETLRLPSEEWRRRAQALALQGRYREAARCLYRAIMQHLDTLGLIQYDPSRTNWEQLRPLQSGGQQALYQTLLPITLEFDRIWYGQYPAGEPEYRRFDEVYEHVIRDT